MMMKKVLFVCVENACRSQMAKGFFNKFTKDAISDSAGTQPSENVDPVAIKVMKELGVDIGNNKPKHLTFEMNNEFEYIVTMGCIDGCPITPKNKTIEWIVEDPKGKDIGFYRRIRDQIEKSIKNLINEMI